MLFTLLLTIYACLFIVLCIRRLDWAVYFILFAPWSYIIRFDVFFVPFTLLEVMILSVSLIWAVKLLRNKRYYDMVLPPKRMLWSQGFFMTAATIGIFVSPDWVAAAGIWKAYFIEPVLFFFVCITVIKTRQQIQLAVWVMLASLVIPGMLALYQFGTGDLITNTFWQLSDTRRATSLYGYPNAIGLYFAPIVVLGVGVGVQKLRQMIKGTILADKKNILVTISILGILGIGFMGIFVAQSKGAVLAVGMALLAFSLFWRGYRLMFAGVVIVVAMVVGMFFPQLLSVQGISNVSGGGSLEVRISQWNETATMLQQHFLLGAGLSGYQAAIEPFHQERHIEIFMYPHQILLNFWTEVGLLGLGAFIWLVILLFNYSIYVQKSYSFSIMPLGGALIALLAHGLVDVPYFKNDLALLFWTLAALMMVYYLNRDTLGQPSINN